MLNIKEDVITLATVVKATINPSAVYILHAADSICVWEVFYPSGISGKVNASNIACFTK